MADFIIAEFDENGFILIHKISEMGLERLPHERKMIIAPLSMWGVEYILAQVAPEYIATKEEINDVVTALLKGWDNWHLDPRNSYRWIPRNDNGEYISMAEQFLRNMEAETGRDWHPKSEPTLGDLLRQKIEDNDDEF